MDVTPEAKLKLRNLLISHESYKQFPYTDNSGNLTIGIGRNLTDRGISNTEALNLLDNDIYFFFNKLNNYLESFYLLDSNRQIALIDMCFTLGVHGFLGFKDLIESVNKRDWKKAHADMINSKWAEQVRERATQLATIILTGELNV